MNREIRDALSDPDYDQLRKQFRGTKYSKLVQEHVRKSESFIQDAIAGCIDAMNSEERDLAVHMIDLYNCSAMDQSFWRRDCSVVFEQIWLQFFVQMSARGRKAENKMAFNIFQLITLNFAIHALGSKELIRQMGLRRSVFSR